MVGSGSDCDVNATSRSIRSRVAEYYSAKIVEHGPSAKGVDWRDEAGQSLRFEVLSRLFSGVERPSITQLGCGYGAFVDFCDRRDLMIDYKGYDVSREMVEAARKRHEGRSNILFEVGSLPTSKAEFCIASGIFNVKFDFSLEAWRDYVHATIDVLSESSTRGFAFNCLSGFADKERMVERLFYTDPGQILDHCLRRYGRTAALRHDYGLFEFTVFVKK